jgi:hypothetical protein
LPKVRADQERLGARWYYDEEAARSDGVYHKLQMQPNTRKVSSSIEEWKRKRGGTHAVVATALVKKGGTIGYVQKGIEEAAKGVKT